ncbi:DMT family transporter [Rhodoferax sp.]|uniref:DMT family transporter n=1 Tax=Rhodoferax sp. TaxID=50421 RepID=UPI002609B729|nr:DMT family transporter [Rhodoferax sp.]MDD2924484.1 DMT family transporter [Rhodoferax sp.]
MTPASNTPHHGNLRSITAMLVAVGFFAFMDTILKVLSGRYPALQVAALRGWVALPLVGLWIHWRGGWHTLWHIRWRLHWLRGALVICMLTLFTRGLQQLPLANAYTLFFVAPLLITLLSAPVLGERVPRAHWWAVAGGMVGVVVALRPGVDGFVSWSGLAVLGAAVCYAVSAVTTRLSSRTDSRESLMLWIMVMVAIGASALAAPQWVSLRQDDFWLLGALAIAGFGGQLAITEAFRHGQASAVAPFEYTALAWGLGVDWLIWATLPDRYTLLGGAIIVASGLYVVRHESVRAATEHP